MTKTSVTLESIDDIEIEIDDTPKEKTKKATPPPEKPVELSPLDSDEIVISTPAKKTPAKTPTNAPQATKPVSQAKTQDIELTFDMSEPEPAQVVGSVGSSKLNAVDSALFDNILAVEEIVTNPAILIYGKNGTGKTTILSTAPGVLILVTDDGTLAIRGKTDKTRTRRLKITDWKQVEQLYFALTRGRIDPSGTGIWIELPDGPFCVRYLAFDTITKLAQICMRAVVLNDASDVTKDILKKGIKDWGDMSERVKHWLGLFKELPMYNVWICQEQSNTENTEDDEYSIFPAVNQSIRIFLQSEADVIGRTVIKRGKNSAGESVTAWCMVVGGMPNAITKDRTNKLKATMVNPSLQKIMDAVQA